MQTLNTTDFQLREQLKKEAKQKGFDYFENYLIYLIKNHVVKNTYTQIKAP